MQNVKRMTAVDTISSASYLKITILKLKTSVTVIFIVLSWHSRSPCLAPSEFKQTPPTENTHTGDTSPTETVSLVHKQVAPIPAPKVSPISSVTPLLNGTCAAELASTQKERTELHLLH